MKLEIGFQPNCSETVFRFSREELGKLPDDMLKAFWVAAANGCTKERLEQNAFACLGLPHLDPRGGEYSSLSRQSQDHFLLSYYQTSNEMLLEFAKNHFKDWLVEAPFTKDEDVPKNHNFDFVEEKTIASIFSENLLPPTGFEAIIELMKEAKESQKKQKDGEKSQLESVEKEPESGQD